MTEDEEKPRGMVVSSLTVYIDERGVEVLQEEGELTVRRDDGKRIHIMTAEFEETGDELEPEARIGLQ